MRQINSQRLFQINQELTACCAMQDNIFAKVEFFHVTPEDVAHYAREGFDKTPFPGSFSSSIDSGFTNPVYGLNPYATSRHFPALKAALSSSFPDYDFSHLCPWHFKLIQSPEQAQANINYEISSFFPESGSLPIHIWQAIDAEINIAVCDIYQYDPDCPDPFTEMNTIKNLCYFFLNEKSDRILFLHCREGGNEDDDSEGSDADSKYGYGFF